MIKGYLILVCMQFIFSTAIDGKIKAWLYDSLGSRVDYDAPGLWCTTMAYSADGTRYFSKLYAGLYLYLFLHALSKISTTFAIDE